MNEHLTYLKLKYGSERYSVSILYELPLELAINAYKKHESLNFIITDLSNKEMIEIISQSLDNLSKNPNVIFTHEFSKILSDEIKKYYG